MSAKLFASLSLDDLSPKALHNALLASLESPNISLTFRWTAGEALEFDALVVTHDQVPEKILPMTLTATSGTHTFPLGNYAIGTELLINFKVKAYTAIPKIVALVSEDLGLCAIQLAPPPPATTQKLEKGDDWPADSKGFKYIVAGGANGENDA